MEPVERWSRTFTQSTLSGLEPLAGLYPEPVLDLHATPPGLQAE